MGLGPLGNVACRKDCISVGFAKVKVVLVLRVMKTLLELMLTVPTWDSAAEAGMTTGGSVLVVVLVVGVAGVAVDLQTEGWPLQTNPFCTWQLLQPAEEPLPVSQVSVPTMRPSPHFGVQAPCELGENPALVQVRQTLADLQVAHEELQARQPLF